MSRRQKNAPMHENLTVCQRKRTQRCVSLMQVRNISQVGIPTASLNILRGLVFACVAMAPHAVFAQQGPDRLCYNNMVGVDPRTVTLYEVDPAESTHFVKGTDADNCPGPGKACQTAAYVVKSNQVIVTHDLGNYACATFVSVRKGKAIGTTGWLPLAALKKVDVAPQWHGHWISSDTDATIDIAAKGSDKIAINAQATWNSTAINGQSGEFSAVVSSNEGYISFTDGDNIESSYGKSACKVQAVQLGRYLVVGDNHECGGSNVTFSSVYARGE